MRPLVAAVVKALQAARQWRAQEAGSRRRQWPRLQPPPPPLRPLPVPHSAGISNSAAKFGMRQGAGSGGVSGRTGDSQQRIDVLEHAVGAANAGAIMMHVLKGLESGT